MANSENWGEVVVGANIKKTTAHIKMNNNGDIISEVEESDDGESQKSRFEQVKERRGKRLGLQ